MTDRSRRLCFDQDADARLADALRDRGFDVVTAFQADLSEADDPAQLTYAAQTERIFVTHNVRHFPAIHVAWLDTGQNHAGIVILIGYPPVGVWLRRMLNLLSTFSRSDLHNQLIYLGTEFD